MTGSGRRVATGSGRTSRYGFTAPTIVRPDIAGLAILVAVLCLVPAGASGVAAADRTTGADASASPAFATVTSIEGASSPAEATAAVDAVTQQAGVGTLAQQADDDSGSATRNGSALVLRVPADRIGDAENGTVLTVAAPDANGSVTVEAARRGDRYVASLPLTDLVGPNVTSDLADARVVASSGGAVVIEATVDLRYLAQTGPATFRNATLAIPADVRGLGGASPTLSSQAADDRFPARVDGSGPNATLLVAPDALANASTNRTLVVDGVVENATVSPAPIEFAIVDAARQATALAYRDGELVALQPLAHPAVGPERVDLTVTTERPSGVYATRTATADAAVPVPPSVVGADVIEIRVASPEGQTLFDVPVAAPNQPTVPLRIANRSLSAPNPATLAAYDTVLVRHDDGVTSVPIEAELRNGETIELTGPVAEPGEAARAILVGDGIPPARADLTVVPPPPAPDPDPEPSNPNQDEFVGIWLDVGSIVGLLLVAMLGSVLSVGFVYSLRRLSPAGSADAGGPAIVGHFLLGGIGGAACIAIAQSLYGGSVLGSVTIAGTAVGLGAILVGTFHGGLTATGLRLGLGTLGAWPTRRVVDETAVPVRVRFTDDEGEGLPGEQTVEVRRADDGSLVETAGLAGTTTEVELPAGEYAIAGATAERESDPVELTIEEPETPRPEERSIHLTVGRPGLQVEVADAQTDDPVPTGQVTITTDRDRTKQVAIEDGTATTTLPVATGTATIVARGPGFDDEEIEVPIEESLTTVDVALAPASGTLEVTATAGGAPIPGATVSVEPAEPSPDTSSATSAEPAPNGGSEEVPSDDVEADDDVGVRTAEGTTDEDGRVSFDLPVGSYRASLTLEGPNAGLFAIADDVGAVAADATASVTVRARFDWEPDERTRRRVARLRKTIRSVAKEATADPTIPLYFAGVTEALLACVEALPASGQHFATSGQGPDRVATATVAAAEAALEAVGQAMQAEGVRAVLGPRSDPVEVSPDLDAAPADLLAYFEQDLAIASVEARAHEVEGTIDREAERVHSVAPARAVVQKAVGLVPKNADGTTAATREFAALLLLNAVEQCFERPEIRSRLDRGA